MFKGVSVANAILSLISLSSSKSIKYRVYFVYDGRSLLKIKFKKFLNGS